MKPQRQSMNIDTVWHSPITVNAPDQKAPNFRQHALPQVMLCPVPSFQIALSPWEHLLIITSENITNDVKLSQSVLGPGHGPLLREDVAAAAIRPTLQGKETSPKMWKWCKGKEKKKNANKITGNKLLQAQSPDVRKRPTVGKNEYLKANKTGLT